MPDIFLSYGHGDVAIATARGVAIFHICSGDLDLAADWFDRSIEERDPIAPALLQSAIGEQLRLNPRWPKLAALMNLSAAT